MLRYQCFDSSHWIFGWVAIAVIIIFTVGLPGSFLLQLVKRRHRYLSHVPMCLCVYVCANPKPYMCVYVHMCICAHECMQAGRGAGDCAQAISGMEEENQRKDHPSPSGTWMLFSPHPTPFPNPHPQPSPRQTIIPKPDTRQQVQLLALLRREEPQP